MPKENKTNLKRTARISVRPCCFVNPKTSSPPYQPFSPPLDYTLGAPPTSPITTPPLSPINTTINSNENCLLTPKSTPPPLTSPPPDPTQPSKLTSPVTINLDPIELLFSNLPSSLSFLDLLGDLPPSTTNPSPPRPSFATIERLANEPPPIPPMDSTFPSPTPELEPTLPHLPPQCLPNPPSQLLPLPPLGPNNPFPLLTHEMKLTKQGGSLFIVLTDLFCSLHSIPEEKKSRRVRMTEVIKREFEKIKDVKVEDVPLICDASLEVFNDEVSRLSKMDDDLFTYEVKIDNIPCDSKIDNDSEQEADDDIGYDPSDVAFIEWLRSKFFNYKTMDHYTMKALWIYWIRGDDEVELTDEESSDNDDEIVEVFRIDTNIFDYETPICSAFNEFNYLLKVDPDLLTKDIIGFKTYEDYKDD
ncbi:hypothetical protein Tco_0499361 [Tanacetum coccineum]